jgi:rod shape-determining protein MreD
MSPMLPALSVLFAVFATVLPWGLPTEATFILPLVVMAMVFCWRALPGARLPSYVAMLLGLLLDVTSGGPLGFWALMSLIAATAGGLSPPLDDAQDRMRLWLAWAVVACFLGLVGWLLASLYFLRWIDWWPIAFGALASIALFPVVRRGVLWIRGARLKSAAGVLYGGWR